MNRDIEAVQRAAADTARVIAQWQELRLRDSLGREFRSTATRIVIRKPAWMPEWAYRRLMRTIVLEEREGPAAPATRSERRAAQRRARR